MAKMKLMLVDEQGNAFHVATITDDPAEADRINDDEGGAYHVDDDYDDAAASLVDDVRAIFKQRAKAVR